MAYGTFATGKFHCFKSEDESLPIMERKKPENSIFVVNGIQTFRYSDIKLRGVPACVGEVQRLIREGKIGKVYQNVFHQVDDQYFTDNDFGMLSSYFDTFMKEVYSILNPPKDISKPPTPKEKKTALNQKNIDLKKQIKKLQAEVQKTEQEAANIDVDAIDDAIDDAIKGREIFKEPPQVSSFTKPST